MHDLTAVTALGGDAARVDQVGATILAEVPAVSFAGCAARRGRADAVGAALSDWIGADPPGPGRWAGGATRAVWTGPDRWLVEAPEDAHPDLAAAAKERLGDAASVTEETDAWARLDLSGGDVVAAMERLCPLDAAAMGPGAAGRSRIHHVASWILRTEAGFAVIAPRAYAGSVHHAVLAAMRSAG